MSGSNNPTMSSTTPAGTVSDPHKNGHLVFTGMYTVDGENVSANITIEEHGWFGNVTIFRQICNNHPTPMANGRSPEEIFFDWRDSLLAFFDSNHNGAGGL
ncbi:hypothetical protein BDU57DRAFT_565176 [Ampelomyces quisqualis]|uniref:Uncharacterized protein n=1 Tax=Ampelomyces quisqualis TaxID=50730 RepID=A0A6A5Q8U7_AMPQU|nr:hypothetical protein BDU57DRAFT_565176 [Ampelomyces quisqualis]